MLRYIILFIVGFTVLNSVDFVRSNDCPCLGITRKAVKVSILARKNATNDWETTVNAIADEDEMPDGLNMSIKQSVQPRTKDRAVLIEGEFELECPTIPADAISYTTSDDHFAFHKRAGANIKLFNAGRTAERKNPGLEFKYGIVVTNQPLKNDELFEIRLDEVITKWSGSIEFGITTNSPLELPLLPYFGDYNTQEFMFYGYQNFTTKGKDPPKHWKYQKGDRFGVKKTSNGEVMYYINGDFIGSLEKKITTHVYGIVDLYGNGVKATILNPL